MCVVSYISHNEGFYFTSNRDIPKNRKVAIFPKDYNIKGHNIIFPKDPDAGGSWIAATSEKLGCVLNAKNKREINNNNSRGLLLIDLLQQDDSDKYFIKTNLEKIYPFSIIELDTSKKTLKKFIWNGDNRKIEKLNINKNYLWLSSSIYKSNTINKKSELFNIMLNTEISKRHIKKFHLENQFHDINQNKINTVSITQVSGSFNIEEMSYHDLLNNKQESFLIKNNSSAINES